MAGLILKLKANEQILVNGVVMQNGDRNARLIVKTPKAKILRLRDAIHPSDVDTPLKRLCYTAQLAVAGEVREEAAAEALNNGILELDAALRGLSEAETLEGVRDAAINCRFYEALRGLRQLLPLEERLLSGTAGVDPVTSSSHEARD